MPKFAARHVHRLTVRLDVVSPTADVTRTAGAWHELITKWLDQLESAAVVVTVEAERVATYRVQPK